MTAPTVQDDTAAQELALDPFAQDLLFRQARTANAFTDEPVTDEQVRAIYELVKWGPTAMNSQPLRLVAVRSKEARERLIKHLSPGNRDKTATAPLTLIVAADNDFHEHLPTVFPHAPNAKDAFADPEARAGAARFNAAIQLGYLIVGIRAAGLAAGPMTGFDADGLSAEFFPDGRHRAIAVVNVGKPGPNAWFDRNPRLDYEQVVTTV
ncbi:MULTISPECIES: malonic semialdehyde reductase [Thermomonospora]|uniref:Nitroreductase n=1 Tax=Thermomonospora curvata (strain ATCC 19995 / DSM 43183 / JCM 3096 / KCTC 9072 / NBRC 15933 / NCIMB 10081 / Henssen B9) TaxID=471852 RepID=D1ACV2_THECD|nr:MULTISPECIES: malonic semialdehyde reductase [Thermomonospora]ACY97441.1 nitroreductase [Thermomonospora curvata DSM 43183]PKK14790.1 MAG: malonic semialdehyde reductase [Thermomonospora sp. CIF 1]